MMSDWLLRCIEEMSDALDIPLVRRFSTRRLRRAEELARRLSDAYGNLHATVREELERRGELPKLPTVFSCPECERSWDNARDLHEHRCAAAACPFCGRKHATICCPDTNERSTDG